MHGNTRQSIQNAMRVCGVMTGIDGDVTWLCRVVIPGWNVDNADMLGLTHNLSIFITN